MTVSVVVQILTGLTLAWPCISSYITSAEAEVDPVEDGDCPLPGAVGGI